MLSYSRRDVVVYSLLTAAADLASQALYTTFPFEYQPVFFFLFCFFFYLHDNNNNNRENRKKENQKEMKPNNGHHTTRVVQYVYTFTWYCPFQTQLNNIRTKDLQEI